MLDPKRPIREADIWHTARHVRFVPKDDMDCSIEEHQDYKLVGNAKLKIEPAGLRCITQMRPPWASIIVRQMDRPIPMPLALVVKAGLKTR